MKATCGSGSGHHVRRNGKNISRAVFAERGVWAEQTGEYRYPPTPPAFFQNSRYATLLLQKTCVVLQKRNPKKFCFYEKRHPALVCRAARVVLWSPIRRTTLSISKPSHHSFQLCLRASGLYLYLYCASLNKICPTGSEKPRKVILRSGNAQKFFLIN